MSLRQAVARIQNPGAWSEASLKILKDCCDRLVELGYGRTRVDSLAIPYIDDFCGSWFIQMNVDEMNIGLCKEQITAPGKERPGFKVDLTDDFTGKEMADRVHAFLKQENTRIRAEAKAEYGKIWGHLETDEDNKRWNNIK